jgi:beta-galactosidase
MPEVAPEPKPRAPLRVRLTKAGLDLDGKFVPLLAGSVHYWRLSPDDWRAGLVGLVDMGLKLVDVYVPWAVHELPDGSFDFGKHDPRLDIRRFLELAHELGLYAIVRPGPHINAELTRFGIPERVVWDEACQARSPNGRRVVLPVPPLAFPVPSYASRAFLADSARWLRACAAELSSLRFPDGPIVLVQADNEGALYFRDGVYDQDWHPDALSIYYEFLRHKYGTIDALSERYGERFESFESVRAPRRLAADTTLELVHHLDWAEAQELVVTRAMRAFRRELEEGGLSGLPYSHNLPLGENATPLDPAALGEELDLLGLDYYHKAGPGSAASIARRTSELSLRAAARGYPAFSCELGAGFPPFFAPLFDHDNAFTALTACAYGLRGFNIYMAVERDRWIGAPIDQHGNRRKSFEFWRNLCAALERTKFWELERKIEVAIVIPRALRRLWRSLHAFGPLSSAWFEIIGGGATDAVVEDEFGLGAPRAVQTAAFLRQLEQTLDRLAIPYALSGSDSVDHALSRARWVVVGCAGALEPELVERIERARRSGAAVSFAPYAPEADSTFRPLARKPEALPDDRVPLVLPPDEDGLARALSRVRALRDLNALSLEPKSLRVTYHADDTGTPRVGFVINPEASPATARLELPGLRSAEDLLDGNVFHATRNGIEVALPPESVRMLALDVAPSA